MTDAIQDRALRTWYAPENPLHDNLIPMALGIASEAGEFVNLVKKMHFKPGAVVTRDMLLEEMGDLLYYVAIGTAQLGVTIDELSQMNRAKLEGGKHGWAEVVR